MSRVPFVVAAHPVRQAGHEPGEERIGGGQGGGLLLEEPDEIVVDLDPRGDRTARHDRAGPRRRATRCSRSASPRACTSPSGGARF
ncbi:hypothetical protein [Streptomyces sp. NPDC055189]